MDFPPVHNSSAKISICGLTECLMYYHDILHIITSDQGITSQQIKHGNRPILMEFTALNIFPST